MHSCMYSYYSMFLHMVCILMCVTFGTCACISLHYSLKSHCQTSIEVMDRALWYLQPNKDKDDENDGESRCLGLRCRAWFRCRISVIATRTSAVWWIQAG